MPGPLLTTGFSWGVGGTTAYKPHGSSFKDHGSVLPIQAAMTKLNGYSVPGSAVFVFSTKPVPGRNTLLVLTGFADFFAALNASGGVFLTVA